MCFFLRVIVTTCTDQVLNMTQAQSVTNLKDSDLAVRLSIHQQASEWRLIFSLCLQHIAQCYSFVFYLLSVNGMEMMTPFPVPTHKRLQDTIRAVILTNENPSLPVPKNKRCFSSKIMSKNNISSITENLNSNSQTTQTSNSLPLQTETRQRSI